MTKCGNCGYVTARIEEQDGGKSGFCSGCGSFLGGRRCLIAGCEAINDLTATHCWKCGRQQLSRGASVSSLGLLAPFILIAILTMAFFILRATGIPTMIYESAMRSAAPFLIQALQWFYLAMGCLILGTLFYPILPYHGKRFIASFYILIARLIVWALSAICRKLMSKQ